MDVGVVIKKTKEFWNQPEPFEKAIEMTICIWEAEVSLTHSLTHRGEN
jgi:hypothetical protein